MHRDRFLELLAILAAVLPIPSFSQDLAIDVGTVQPAMQRPVEQREKRATGSLSGATLGLVFDEAVKGLRVIHGVPGASELGEPLELGLDMRVAVISPRQDYVLAVKGEDRVLVQIRMARGTTLVRALEGAAPGPDRIALSPRGTAGALYYRESGKVQVLTGLPEEAVRGNEVEIPAFIGSVGAMAISDDGRALLIAPAEEGAGLVHLSEPGADVRPVWMFGRVSAMEFLERSHDAVIADREENKVYLLRGVTGSAALLLLAEEKDGIIAPRALAAAGDGRQVVVANDLSKDLVIVDLGGSPPAKLACNCLPTGFHRLLGTAVFRLTGLASGPVWVYDGDGEEPRIVFVPSAAGPVEGCPELGAGRAGQER